MRNGHAERPSRRCEEAPPTKQSIVRRELDCFLGFNLGSLAVTRPARNAPWHRNGDRPDSDLHLSGLMLIMLRG
jgi:hypothetical protein